MTSKPMSISLKIFNKNLVSVHKIKETLTLNRPAYVDMCIHELSKKLMHADYHYNYIKQKSTITKQNYYSQTQTA